MASLHPHSKSCFPTRCRPAPVLVAVAAATSPGVRIVAGKDATSDPVPLALRLAIVGEERALPQTLEPVLEAAYEVQAMEVEALEHGQGEGGVAACVSRCPAA